MSTAVLSGNCSFQDVTFKIYLGFSVQLHIDGLQDGYMARWDGKTPDPCQLAFTMTFASDFPQATQKDMFLGKTELYNSNFKCTYECITPLKS